MTLGDVLPPHGYQEASIVIVMVHTVVSTNSAPSDDDA